DARDGRRLQVAQVAKDRLALNDDFRQQAKQTIEGYSADVPVGIDNRTVAHLDTGNAIVAYLQSASGTSEDHADAVLSEPGLHLLAVEPAQRHRRQFHLK